MSKKFLIVFFSVVAIVASSVPSYGKKGVKPKTLMEMLENIDWKTPEKTGEPRVDNLNDKCDKLFKGIKTMSDSLPVYSMRSIVENGDTVAIVIVDAQNRPYDSTRAKFEMVEGAAYLANVINSSTPIASEYVNLVKELPNIVKSKGLASISIISNAGKTSNKVGKLVKDFLPTIKSKYSNLSNPVKEYCDAQVKLSKDDGFLTTGFDHVPEFDPDEMPSDEELDRILEMEREARM